LIVLLIILIVLALIIYLPISVEVKYIDGDFSYKVKYAFITFYPRKSKKSKKAKKSKKFNFSKFKKKNKKKNSSNSKPKEKHSNNMESKETSTNIHEKSSETSEEQESTLQEKSEEPSSDEKDVKALDTLSMALDIFKLLKDKFDKFIKSIRITDLYINFQVADQDAYDCALKYGKVNIILGNILGYLSWNFKVKKKSISVQPKYNSNDSVYDVSFKVKIGFGSGLGKILVMVFKVIPILKENDIL